MDHQDGGISRRRLLASAAAIGGGALAGFPLGSRAAAPTLTIASRTLDVNGKAAKVFSALGPNNRPGIIAREGEQFSGTVLNASATPIQMHWHGQVLAPAEQDRARPDGGLLAPQASDNHAFPLTPGTHWMHSHTLAEQQLLAAPMIAIEKNAGDVQDVVVILHDFSFRSPEEILAELGGAQAHGGHTSTPEPSPGPATRGGMAGHDMPGGPNMPNQGMMGQGMMGQRMGNGAPAMGGHMMGMAHANDVRYDAYLANDRTLADPEVVAVEKGGRVRLRIINAGTATSFFLATPGLASRCIAVDGSPCAPVTASSYPLAQGQRIDLAVDIPKEGGAFPLLAQVEGAAFVTGIVLATSGAAIKKLASTAAKAQPLVDLSFESRLRATQPLSAKPADKSFMLMLGEQPNYRWTINGRVHGEHTPLAVRAGERVHITYMNPTAMMHPMHMHGHHVQVVSIGGRALAGAIRDTIMVPGHTPVTIAFDALNKGQWFLHCHHLYHMATGMMTEVNVT